VKDKKLVIIVGPPCSGKGTQCEKLTKHGLTHLSMGDILREDGEAVEILNKPVKSLVYLGLLAAAKQLSHCAKFQILIGLFFKITVINNIHLHL